MKDKAHHFYLDTERLNWLLLSFIVVSLPHIFRMPFLFGLYAVLIALARYFIARNGMALPGALVRAGLILCALGLMFISYDSFIGKDPGIALLISMLSLKLLEIKTKRDVLFFLFMNYFLIGSHFLFSQTVLIAIYSLLAILINTFAIILINRHLSEHHKQRYLRLSVLMMVQALPLMLIMFVLFPRIQGPFLSLPGGGDSAKTGLSDTMSPGDISKLSRSNAIAFRVTFESNPKSTKTLYWRGPVLNSFDGRSWSNVTVRAPYSSSMQLIGPSIRYTITLEAQNSHILPALDLPHILPPESRLDRQYVLHSRRPNADRQRYTVISKKQYIVRQPLSPLEKHFYLRMPPNMNSRSIQLARTLRQNSNDLAYARNVLQYFKQTKFYYSLSPPKLGKNSIDEFLFKTRKGYCEHFASAYVALMRYGGVPARVVTGYQGAEFNPVGNYYVIRQSLAHAWAEVWLRGQGWIRVDPTGTVPPERVEKDIEHTISSAASWNGLPLSRYSWTRSLSQYWDSFNNKWNQLILGYGEQLQAALLSWLGLGNPGWLGQTLWLTGLLIVALVALSLYYKNFSHTIRKGKVEIIYDLFCRKLSKIGLGRENWEGPDDYVTRVLNQRRDLHEEVLHIIDIYKALRYSATHQHESVHAFRTLVRHFKPSRHYVPQS